MAKGFQFNLQKVLNIRQMTEDMQAIQMHRAKHNLDTEQRQLLTLENEKFGTISSNGEITLSLNQLKITTDYVNQLNNRIDVQKQKVVHSERKVERCRQALHKATMDKKIVEKLKENKQLQYRSDMNKKLQRDESEIAIRTALSKNREN